MTIGECFPSQIFFCAIEPLVDDQQVRRGDGLVIQAWLPLRFGEPAKCRTETHERFRQGVMLKVVPGGADVLAVMKPAGWFLTRLKGGDKGAIVHRKTHSLGLHKGTGCGGRRSPGTAYFRFLPKNSMASGHEACAAFRFAPPAPAWLPMNPWPAPSKVWIS